MVNLYSFLVTVFENVFVSVTFKCTWNRLLLHLNDPTDKIVFSPNKIVSKFSYHSEWNHGTRSENLFNFFIQVENMKILSNNTGKILILEFIFLDVHRNLNISTSVSINHLRYPLFNNHDFDWFLCPSIFFPSEHIQLTLWVWP